MNSFFEFRKATVSDLPFIVEGIVEAEKSGTPHQFYELTFGLNEDETKQLILSIFEEEIEQQEWCLSNFYVATENGHLAACLSTWIEKSGMESSGILKAQALSYFLGDKLKQATDKLHITAEVQIDRTPNAIQLECIYTAPSYRGHGIAASLIQYTINTIKAADQSIALAEIQLMAENDAALRSYTKCGFFKGIERRSQHPEILNLLPGTTRVVLSANI